MEHFGKARRGGAGSAEGFPGEPVEAELEDGNDTAVVDRSFFFFFFKARIGSARALTASS
jgi:hypothetical protein